MDFVYLVSQQNYQQLSTVSSKIPPPQLIFTRFHIYNPLWCKTEVEIGTDVFEQCYGAANKAPSWPKQKLS